VQVAGHLEGASDLDVGKNGVNTYKLSNNDYFTLDIHKGEDSVSAELVLQKSLDREQDSVIKLTLTAVDGGNPPKSGTSLIIISVMDTNDNHPVFSKSLYKIKIPENLSSGSTVITLNATDTDEGSNSEIEYSLRKKGKQTDVFSIDEQTGTVTNKRNIDFEENNAFELRVKASDGASSPMSSHAKLLIEVLDVNDNAPEISVTSLLNTVKEDASLGTAIALVSVFDKDGGKNGMVICKISNNGSFPSCLRLFFRSSLPCCSLTVISLDVVITQILLVSLQFLSIYPLHIPKTQRHFVNTPFLTHRNGFHALGGIFQLKAETSEKQTNIF
uniref:Cadherin domain-containing protein n=1 Tax=Astatotilapia calliptera TaxID=8154 RepID=A0AAX7SSE9_ASTCA